MQEYYSEEDVLLKTSTDRGVVVFFKDGTYKYGADEESQMLKRKEGLSSFWKVENGSLYYFHGRKITDIALANKWTSGGHHSSIYIENKLLEKLAGIELEKAIFEE